MWPMNNSFQPYWLLLLTFLSWFCLTVIHSLISSYVSGSLISLSSLVCCVLATPVSFSSQRKKIVTSIIFMPVQEIVYPVSLRSLRIEFGALRTNCETQSEKVRIKKIELEMLRPCIAHCDRSQSTAVIISSDGTPLRRLWKRPHLSSRSMRVDQGWSKPHEPTASFT